MTGLTINRSAVPGAFVFGGGFGNMKVAVVEVTFDSSYATGGESLTASDLGLQKVHFAICNIVDVGADTVNVTNAYYDKTASTVVLIDETPAVVTGDVSAVVVQVVAFGK